MSLLSFGRWVRRATKNLSILSKASHVASVSDSSRHALEVRKRFRVGRVSPMKSPASSDRLIRSPFYLPTYTLSSLDPGGHLRVPTRGAGRLPGSEDGLSICVLNGTRRPPSLPLPPSYPSRRRPAEPTRHARSSISHAWNARDGRGSGSGPGSAAGSTHSVQCCRRSVRADDIGCRILKYNPLSQQKEADGQYAIATSVTKCCGTASVKNLLMLMRDRQDFLRLSNP